MTAPYTRWWERPRTRGRQGDLAKQAGSDLLIECPKCKEVPVVYNGNYFCDNWRSEWNGKKWLCDWALAHPARSKRDRAVCDLLGIDYL